MPDTKITALTAIGANPIIPSTFPIPMVDLTDTSMAASGTTKKVTVNQILGAGGTATLASATITGDLTVDTSTLKVDSALNNVGIGTASPNNNTNRSTLTINNGTWGGQLDINVGATNHANFGTDNFDSGASCRLQSKDSIVLKTAGTGASSYLQLISSTGVTTWYDGAGGTRMTLNSTGLGIGASPASYGGTFRTLAVNATDAGILDLMSNSVSQFRIFGNGSENRLGGITNVPLTFHTNNSEKMRLDASGNLLVGTTSNAPGGTQSQFVNQWSGAIKWGSTFNQTVSSATPYTHIAFCTNGTVRGSIDANNTTITYSTVSDYRLKEAVQPLVGGLARISALKPSTYKWKESQSDGEGFIAHELASVVPLAVIGEKDALNEDGSIKAQQVDLSKVVPVLVAAIQELAARVQTLETR